MKNATQERLAAVARQCAGRPFHGRLDGAGSNIREIIDCFPRWDVDRADRLWCAAFVYYCCVQAGFELPYSPDECVTCSLAGCGGWEEFAQGDARIGYFRRTDAFQPASGDIVLYDRICTDAEHDHIGVILEAAEDELIVAEGNADNENISKVVRRPIDGHIRAYIRIPDGFRY